jgi:chitinase
MAEQRQDNGPTTAGGGVQVRGADHWADEPWDEDWPDDDPPAERLSWTRAGILVLVLAAVAATAVFGARRALTPGEPAARSWGVPYIDVTLTPAYPFQDPGSNPARNVALAFVVASPATPCSPSWGAAYSLDEAGRQLELDRRIVALRAAGGDIMISFGGQANSELAVACTDTGQLTAAYRQVVDRYHADAVDLDIEGTAMADLPSIQRRAEAIAAVQRERPANRPLAVWLTVPVARSGLTSDAAGLVARTLQAGVSLTGVNVMTMDFGADARGGLLATSKEALEASARQLGGIYARLGVTLDGVQRWARLGATPMIGQNDDQGVFTLADARALVAFARAKGLGRLSLWSINRDAPCGPAFANVAVHSTTCSGVTQQPLAFAGVFAALPGRDANSPGSDAITIPSAPARPDDPATSPYPVWRPTAQYPEGYKVVWHGQVYQALWWTQGTDPSSLAASGVPDPWSHLGPVGAQDAAPAPSPVVTGVRERWTPDKLYVKGDRVVLGGLPYQARWVTKGDVPPTEFPVGADSPWQPLFSIPGEPATP